MIQEKWEEFYFAAAVEVDGKRMPDRIATVREAIRGRLQELVGSSDHYAERERMKTTLEHLKVLEAEARQW